MQGVPRLFWMDVGMTRYSRFIYLSRQVIAPTVKCVYKGWDQE